MICQERMFKKGTVFIGSVFLESCFQSSICHANIEILNHHSLSDKLICFINGSLHFSFPILLFAVNTMLTFTKGAILAKILVSCRLRLMLCFPLYGSDK